jgi:hypothetical protein
MEDITDRGIIKEYINDIPRGAQEFSLKWLSAGVWKWLREEFNDGYLDWLSNRELFILEYPSGSAGIFLPRWTITDEYILILIKPLLDSL